jgi:hypothetical protein
LRRRRKRYSRPTRRARQIVPPAAVPAIAPGLRVGEEEVEAAAAVWEVLGWAIVTTVLWMWTMASSS